VGTATSYAGIDQSTPISAVNGSNGTGLTLATNITTVTDNSWIEDCAIGRADTPSGFVSVGAGQVVRTNRLANTTDAVGVSTVNGKSPAGSEVMDWTQGGSSDWVMSAVALKPAGAVAPPPPTAAISFDAVSNSVANNTAAILPTFVHTVAAGSNRFLAVCTQSRGSLANVPVASLTYGGTGLTFARGDTHTDGAGTYWRTELWYLIAPPAGAANVAVTFTGSLTGYGAATSTSFQGVDQTTPIDASAGANGSSTTLSATITTVTAGAWIEDCAIGRADSPSGFVSVGSGQVARMNRVTTVSNDDIGVSTVNGKSPAGSEVMDWTQSGSQDWVLSAVAFKPAP
jgi:hypothetical protein